MRLYNKSEAGTLSSLKGLLKGPTEQGKKRCEHACWVKNRQKIWELDTRELR